MHCSVDVVLYVRPVRRRSNRVMHITLAEVHNRMKIVKKLLETDIEFGR